MKEPAKSGGEQDVVTRWRRLLCWTQKAGACAYWKRRIRRRERHRAKQELGGAE